MENNIDELIIKYLAGTLTVEEQAILDEWKALPENKLLLDQLSDGLWVRQELQKIHQVNEENAYNKLSQVYAQQSVPIIMHKTRGNRVRYLVAASLILIIGAGIWFLLSPGTGNTLTDETVSQERFKNDVPPGGIRLCFLRMCFYDQLSQQQAFPQLGTICTLHLQVRVYV